jgi:hypothetical protein
VEHRKCATYGRGIYLLKVFIKRSLKILKEQSESVYRKRTDNTMAKRKSTKGQTTIYKKKHITRTPLTTEGELIYD